MLSDAFAEKRRLLAGLTLILSVGFVLTSVASYFVSRNSIRAEIVSHELPLTTDNIYSEIQKDLVAPVLISSVMSRDTFVRDWTLDGERDAGRIARYLKEVQLRYGAVTTFFVSERSRNYYYGNGILKKVAADEPADAWYFRVRAMAAPYEMNVDPDAAHDNAMTVFVNYRVFDYQEGFLGAIGVGLPLQNLDQLIDKYQRRFHRTVYMADRRGRILLRGGELAATGSLRDLPGLADRVDAILGGAEGAFEYDRDGRRRLLNVRLIPELDWFLFVEKAEDEAYADIFRTLLMNLALCAAITAVVAFAAGVNVSRYQARLRQAVEDHTRDIEAASHARSLMLAYVGHDLRAPLAGIAHYLRRIEAEPDHAQRYRDTIEQSVQHQLALIDELVEYARGELDRIELLPVPTYLHSWLRGVAGQGELMAAQHGNGFRVVVGDDLPPVVVMDPKRMRQVLTNLLANAAKFTTHGEVELRVERLPAAEGGALARLRFAVADTGPGIASEHQARLFRPFERGDIGRPGYGLGLAIADQITRRMGALLELESQSGRGACFRVELPLETAAEADVLLPAQTFELPEPFGAGRRALIADFGPAEQDYLSEVLAAADLDVVRCQGGGIAGEDVGAFDIVLADQESGWQLLRRASEPAAARSPAVILLSATPPRRPDDVAPELRFRAELLKPASPDRLLESVRKALAQG
jgi:signal transduction histidine kinase